MTKRRRKDKEDSLLNGKVAWFDLDVWEESHEHQYCEAPVHQHTTALEVGVPPADYVMVLHYPELGYDNYFQAMCRVCMDGIAADLGTTAEEGKLELHGKE